MHNYTLIHKGVVSVFKATLKVEFVPKGTGGRTLQT